VSQLTLSGLTLGSLWAHSGLKLGTTEFLLLVSMCVAHVRPPASALASARASESSTDVASYCPQLASQVGLPKFC